MAFLHLLALGAAVVEPPRVQARATIRILNPVVASEHEWSETAHRSERIVREADGQLIRLRTIDYE